MGKIELEVAMMAAMGICLVLAILLFYGAAEQGGLDDD